MGLLCTTSCMIGLVLAVNTPEYPRLLYRARYYNRIVGN